MFARLLGSFSALLLLWLGVFAATQAGEMKIVLRDCVDQQWSSELLTYPFSAAEKECRVESLTLTNPLGQPVPVQLSDRRVLAGHAISQGGEAVLHRRPGPAGQGHVHGAIWRQARGREPARPGPEGGRRRRPWWRSLPRQFGARILLGEQTYAQPVAASEVPGPVIAMRTGGRHVVRWEPKCAGRGS